MEKIKILPAEDLEMLKRIVDTLAPVASKHNIWNPEHPVLDKDSWLKSNPAVLATNRNSLKINEVSDSQIKLVNDELASEKKEMEKLIASVKSNTVPTLKKDDFINPIIQELVETLQKPKSLVAGALSALSSNLKASMELNTIKSRSREFSEYITDRELIVKRATYVKESNKIKVFTEDELYSQYKKDHLLVKEKFFESQKLLLQETKKFDSLSTLQIKELTKNGDLTNEQVHFYIKHLKSEEKRIGLDASFADHYEARNRETEMAVAIGQRAKALESDLNPKKEVLLNHAEAHSKRTEIGL